MLAKNTFKESPNNTSRQERGLSIKVKWKAAKPKKLTELKKDMKEKNMNMDKKNVEERTDANENLGRSI